MVFLIYDTAYKGRGAQYIIKKLNQRAKQVCPNGRYDDFDDSIHGKILQNKSPLQGPGAGGFSCVHMGVPPAGAIATRGLRPSHPPSCEKPFGEMVTFLQHLL